MLTTSNLSDLEIELNKINEAINIPHRSPASLKIKVIILKFFKSDIKKTTLI